MNILSFDTTGKHCQVAVITDQKIVYSQTRPSERVHSQWLIPMIQEGLETAKCAMENIDFIATTLGPGSFTGIRIGLATARGLSIATGTPIIGVTAFEVLAHQVLQIQSEQRNILVVIDSQRADIYTHFFDSRGQELMAPAALMPEDILEQIADEPLFVVGSGLGKIRYMLKKSSIDVVCLNESIQLSAECIGLYAMSISDSNRQGCVSRQLSPFYLKSPSIIKLNNG
jgi:tRNA threonylcarbamoyladenosine biosynthesis protein TsaB